MKILHLKTGGMEVNTYAVFQPDNPECVVIDPGAEGERILARLEEYGVKCAAVLLTHGHFDHIGAVKFLQERGASVYVHRLDAEMLESDRKNLGNLVGQKIPPVVPDVLLSGGERLLIAGLEIEVIHTPGHTPGGVCYLIGHNLFSGDTLFYRGVGRCDFPGGDRAALEESIRGKLFTLEEDCKVYPGHDDFTTLDEEREQNPEVRNVGDVYGF